MKGILCIFLLLVSSNAFAQNGQPGTQRKINTSTAAFSNPIIRNISFDQLLGSEIPLDIFFSDERGNRKSLREYFAKKPVILTLVYYTCPMLCTQVLNGLRSTMNVLPLSLGRDYDIVTVSIDPQETPELAAQKKENYVSGEKNIDPNGWHFLTGTANVIDSLTNAAGFHAVHDSISGQYAHAAGIIILTPEGKISRYLFGIEYAPRDLEFSLMEASHNQIGSFTSRLLLLCYRYDPATGKYGSIVLRSIQIGGIAVLLLVVSMMIFLKPKWKKKII